MNKKLLIFLIITLSISCNQIEREKNIDRPNKKNISSLKITEKKQDKENIKKHKIVRIHKLKFPANYVLEEVGPAGDAELYYFYSDNIFLLRDLYSDDDFSIGSWTIVNDTIKVFVKEHFGYRGIGEENIPEGMETVEHSASYGFDEYVKFYENVDYKFKISLNDTAFGFYIIDTTLFANDLIIKPNKYMIDGNFSIASMKELTTTDLKKYTSKELKLMRNEIFARYGYKFKSKDLIEYFNSKGWYKPQKNNVDIYLTNLEKKNINFIKKLEFGQE